MLIGILNKPLRQIRWRCNLLNAHRGTHIQRPKMLQKLRLQERRRHVSRYNCYNAFHWLITICLENLPKGRLDQVVMFMFLCALFPFLHAFLGIGGETCPVKDATDGHPHKLPGKNTSGFHINVDEFLVRETHA